MFGAIIGDIIGSRFEWDNIKTKDFTLFEEGCSFTDDTVMTLAVAQALMETAAKSKKDQQGKVRYDHSILREAVIRSMRDLGMRYPDAGYGGMFFHWLRSDVPKPYGSYGNGAAMRIGPVGFVSSTVDEAIGLSRIVTSVTHDHPEGIKGAEAVAVAIVLAREGKTKEEIKEYVEDRYYRLDFTLDSIRKSHMFDQTCQGTVPEALECFFESDSFEDAIRNAISLGGDTDTLAAITGSVAEAYYGIPEEIITQAKSYLDAHLGQIASMWEHAKNDR